MVIPQGQRGKLLLLAAAAMVVELASPALANSAVNYGYDLLGRVATALYDNGLCVAYTYDANGNRTSQVNSMQTAVWGSSAWGCFKWTP
ncbi:RHS repeat domain-containing protein [Mesorhizobium captivum]|uniref:RHS repeat domain-containing protein n=1 Tax=Mesorhizobium captivum TaxID=3072319 RepID=UPI002A23D4A9|nr:RHS repeat domain-containing protein [Mesorhizobium sp. VK3C]MDX8448502.1 RHS repeat domain-containing protein [Mesorhizobium sp. VK3C]